MFPNEGEEVPDCVSLEKRVIPSAAPLLPISEELVRCAECGEFRGIMAFRDVPQLQDTVHLRWDSVPPLQSQLP